mgnify:FL=1
MIFEDIPVMPWVIREAERVVYDTNVIYAYRINKKGLSHSKFSSSSFYEMDAYYMNIMKGREERDGRITLYSSVFFLTKYYYYSMKVHSIGVTIKEYREKYGIYAKEAWKELLSGGFR